MKNFIYRTQGKIVAASISAKLTANRAKAALINHSGQGALDTVIQVLISIVLGALILAGLYLILNATVLPNIKDRILEMFNYGG